MKTFIIILIIVVFLILFFISIKNKHKIVKLFDEGNVTVTGLRGRGKDMLFCVVVNSRKKDYISNVRYSSPNKKFKWIEFDPKDWDLNGNTYENFINSDLNFFDYKYTDGTDYYISDCGVYFPSQYQSELVKKYKSAPLFQALSRHLGKCNIHANAQRIGRIWDKIREQSDIYIGLKCCKCFFGFTFLSGNIYQTEEACNKLLTQPKFSLFGKSKNEQRVVFETVNGKIEHFWFVTRIPYKYDDRRFKTLLLGGKKNV